jgi:DNA-binding LacI/PurR family transcriptional regulator
MKPLRTVTLNDVAAAANISTATVSHYLNKTKPVSPATGKRVQLAIDRLGYQRDSMAAWFKMSHAPLVIVAVATADTSFFSDVADAIEDICESRNLSVIRVQIKTLEKMRSGNSMSAFLRRATGVIVLGHGEQWIESPEELAATIPMVFLNWDLLSGFGQQGLVDHLADGTYRAMEYLFSHGHRDVGLVTGPLRFPRGQELMAGVQRFAAQHPVNIDQRWIKETDYTFKDARNQAVTILRSKRRPTAMLTFGTQFAFGVLQAATQLNLLVPRDLSIISYIDVKQADFSSPPLTTISPSIPQLATHVVDRLTRLSHGETAAESTVLDLVLCERGSVSAPALKTVSA